MDKIPNTSLRMRNGCVSKWHTMGFMCEIILDKERKILSLIPVSLSGELQLSLHSLHVSTQVGFVKSQTSILLLQAGQSEKQLVHFTPILALLLLQLPESQEQIVQHIVKQYLVLWECFSAKHIHSP